LYIFDLCGVFDHGTHVIQTISSMCKAESGVYLFDSDRFMCFVVG
jgi:hypothetical protein